MMLPRRTFFDFTGHAKRQIWLGRLSALVTLMAQSVLVIGGQELGKVGRTNLLPPPTGEPFTIAAKDLPDIACSVVEWKDEPPKPALSVVCPAQDVFAPIHVYRKLSWLKR
jgi:hypothetical protein